MLAFFAAAPPAHAVFRVLPTSGASISVLHVRVVIAFSKESTTLWAAVRVRSEAERVAVLLPVAPESSVDRASDAWLEALDEASAPRILVPAQALLEGSCALASRVDDTRDTESMHGVPAGEVHVLTSLASVSAFAAAHSLTLTAEDVAKLAAASASSMFLALVYQLDSETSWTETVRVVYPTAASGSGAFLDLQLPRADAGPSIAMTLYTLGAGRARRVPGSELGLADVRPTFFALRGTSDYRERSKHLLEAGAGDDFLLDSSGTSAVFDWQTLPRNAGSIAPVLERYFERSLALGESSSDVRDCKRRLLIARDDGARGREVAKSCAPGLLGRTPSAEQASVGCKESPTPSQVDPEQLRCGGADDFAMAFSGHRPDKVRLTRHSLLLGRSSGPSQLELFDGPVVSAAGEATALNTDGCRTDLGRGAGGGTASTGFSGRPSTTAPEPEFEPGGVRQGRGSRVETHCGSSAGSSDACSGGTPQGNDDSCSGDPSGGSDEAGDGCGSDDSSGYDGETCSDDSSDASGEDGETCSDDSSDASGEDGETCSDDSSDSSGYDGDTCSGEGESGKTEDDCAVARRSLPRARVRPRLSLLTLILAAFLLPIRRYTRRRAKRQLP